MRWNLRRMVRVEGVGFVEAILVGREGSEEGRGGSRQGAATSRIGGWSVDAFQWWIVVDIVELNALGPEFGGEV